MYKKELVRKKKKKIVVKCEKKKKQYYSRRFRPPQVRRTRFLAFTGSKPSLLGRLEN